VCNSIEQQIASSNVLFVGSDIEKARQRTFHRKETNLTYKSHQTHLSPAEVAAVEQQDLRKLVNFVEEAFESIAKLTRLPVSEVLHIIEEVDVAQLRQATQDAIKTIANATALDTAQITAIFKANRAANIDDIVNRLHEESRIQRARI